MTWLVLFEFENGGEAALTYTVMSEALAKFKMTTRRSGLREIETETVA